ncbi:amino acid/amide ABC transporter membrane protein 2, HAAT family [Poseidonocella pacifica]|uniref:Amino acid/amide ABC transporter membrane protein 2, HAAT family n=1 Tax=Poseidonocella pacifica TaxID=871651 RepID=A0A1I0WH77_9RHOB|nr:branched-chain amino acid ABC transporter permease [Poseidonocella pacifica]SFA87747.1 amino acid/amide ABC transporter membrane protein 2, HAAT family [Poseidonocella pacifica]
MTRETALNLALALALPAFVASAYVAEEPFLITLATRAAILALAATGLNLALGFGGLVSFGHAAFFGIGGYATGILASHAQDYTPLMESPFLIEGTQAMLIHWPVGMIAAGCAALVIGALSLRTSGVYFIMITLAFAQMFYYFAISWPAYGGEDGLPLYLRSSFPGMNTLQPLPFFTLVFVVLILAIGFCGMLSASRFGLALHGARQTPARLVAAGIGPFGVRMTAFVISAMLTALAGSLFADLNRFVSPSMMSWHLSGELIVLVILGGVGRLFGPLAGAMLYVAIEHVAGGLTDHWQFFVGLLLLAVVLFARGGLIGLLAGERGHV